MSWETQYAIDNTWNRETEEVFFCEKCEKDTPHTVIEGSNAFDQSLFITCNVCDGGS